MFCNSFISPLHLWVFRQFSWFSLAVWKHFPSPFSSVLWTLLIYKRLIGYIYFGNHGIYSAQFCDSIFPLSFSASHLWVWLGAWLNRFGLVFPVPCSIFLLKTPWWFLVFIHFWLKFSLGDLTRTFPNDVTWFWRKGKLLLEECGFLQGCMRHRLRVRKGFSFTQILPGCCHVAQAPSFLGWQTLHWPRVCPHLPRFPLFLSALKQV